MNLTTKEQVLHYMIKGEIRMSSQDASFFQTMFGFVFRNKKITSNQDKLLNKLLIKHKTQLKRKGLSASKLCELPWAKATLIDSQEDFVKANIKLIDNTLYLRTPYNKKFISELKNDLFVWHTGSRNYQAPFSTRALKVGVNLVKKHFNEINLCPALTVFLEQVPTIESMFWRPTLVKGKTGFYIASSNNILAEKIQDIELKQDPITFFQLSKLGISIDPLLIGEDKFAKFAAHFYNEFTINSSETYDKTLMQISDWLCELNISKVVLGKEPRIPSNREMSRAMKRILARNMVVVNEKDHNFKDEAVVINFAGNYSDEITAKIVKKIVIRDSKPIKI